MSTRTPFRSAGSCRASSRRPAISVQSSAEPTRAAGRRTRRRRGGRRCPSRGRRRTAGTRPPAGEGRRRVRPRPDVPRPKELRLTKFTQAHLLLNTVRSTVSFVDLELRHLRIVCAIAEAGSVTKAAAALGLAQPALATQLKRIERSLGGPLFLRDRRGTRPTPLGDLVL